MTTPTRSETVTTPTRMLNISGVVLTLDEQSLLSKGLGFCPTPLHDLKGLDDDLYNLSRIIRLKYHFRNNKNIDPSIVKAPSSFSPVPNQCQELETVINKLKNLTVSVSHPTDNIKELRPALCSLMKKTANNEIVIKSADKGDVTVIMSAEYYLNMCMEEINKEEYYEIIGEEDPSESVLKAVCGFADNYQHILTQKEYNYLVENKYKMAHFYMLPKLHKSQFLNETLGRSSYVYLPDFHEEIQGRPIVGGPCYFTSGLSEMVDIILKPIISHLPQLLSDSFDLLGRLSDAIQDGVPFNTLLSSCDIKSLYTNISRDLAIRSIDYWVTKYEQSLPIFQRFSKNFVLNALQIILDFNYFMFNDIFVKQIKGFAMGTKAAVNCANLTVGYLEVTMFDMLPTIYPNDFVDFLIRNYFRFLDDIFHLWLKDFDINLFYSVFEELDPDLKFIFSTLSAEMNFMDISFKVVDNKLTMDIYHKPTDSHNYLNYGSCHPCHTRDNIALSLAKRIVRIVSDNREEALDDLKQHLVRQDHPTEKINYAFSRSFSPVVAKPKSIIVFISTHNPTHRYDRRPIQSLFADLHSPEMRKTFANTSVVMGTRQPASLRKLLVRSRFSSNQPKTPRTRAAGLFPCRGGCIYHNRGYIRPAKFFTFGKNKEFTWEYTRFFNCDSCDVIYLCQCASCWEYYIGETGDLKERTRLHKSNTLHPRNANCRKLSEHLHRCSGLKREPYFHIYPMYYVADQQRRRFVEKRFIQRFKPTLNSDGI